MLSVSEDVPVWSAESSFMKGRDSSEEGTDESRGCSSQVPAAFPACRTGCPRPRWGPAAAPALRSLSSPSLYVPPSSARPGWNWLPAVERGGRAVRAIGSPRLNRHQLQKVTYRDRHALLRK